MRTLYWYFYFCFSLLAVIPSMFKYRKLKNTLPEEEFLKRANEYTSKWALKQVKNSGADIRITGLENIPENEAVLFVSNHQGNFDIAIFMAYINKPKGFIAKTEMLKVPVINTWMGFIRCLFMDRSDIRSAAKVISEGIDILKNGYSMVIFPEGTRSKCNQVSEFKAGSFKLATKSQVKIVPVTIQNSFKLMEENNNKIKPATVYVTIHPPVETKGLSKTEQNELPEKVKSIIENVIK